MAQPATTQFEFSAPPADVFAPEILPGVRGGYEGPANRALNELSLALSADSQARPDDKWASGTSLRFILASCGLFWLLGAVLFYALT